MACRISELVIDAAIPVGSPRFLSQVLGYVELGREDDGSIEIRPSDVRFGGLQVLPTYEQLRGGQDNTGNLPASALRRVEDAESAMNALQATIFGLASQLDNRL